MNKLLCFCLSILAAISAMGLTPGLSAAKCFTDAPGSVIPLLSGSVRLDMLDYFNAGSDKASLNGADGEARILEKSDYSLTFQIADGITAQMFVLNPMDKCPIIGYIETVSLPACDSSVRFFNCRWQPVNVLSVPGLSDWLLPGAKTDLDEIERTLPFILSTCEYSPRDATLTFTNNTKAYFAPSDLPEVLSDLRPEITLHWTGKKFK